MQITTPEELQYAINKYKENHPRTIIANFEGEPREYPVEQPVLDIIEALERRVKELENK